MVRGGERGMSRPLSAIARRVSRLACAVTIMGMLGLAGCGEPEATSSPAAKPSFSGVKLTVAAVQDAAILASVSTQRGEWVASRGGEIVIREEPIRSLDNLGDVDLLIFPGQEFGNLVDAELLETIPNERILPPRPADGEALDSRPTEGTEESPQEAFQYNDLAPVFREQVSKYGSDRLALPLGGSALVLVYQREAYTRPANREAAKAVGISLAPPETWTQLDAQARFFEGRDWNGDGTPDHGIAAVLGRDSEGLGDATFLARAATLGQHRDQFSFLFDSDAIVPRIAAPPFVEALRGVLAWKSFGPKGIEAFDAAAARAAFRDGKTVFLIDRAERAAAWSGGHPVGVAPLPGSDRVYEPLRKHWESPSSPNAPRYLPVGGGWLVGVKRGLAGPSREAALDLAVYLASPEIVNRLRSERLFPMLPVRSTHMSQGIPDPTSAPDVDPRQWVDAVSRTLMAERLVPGLRIPDAAGYLDDLAKARVSALAGKDVEAALGDVAEAWTTRTIAKGPLRQLWHYRRSLNSLSTLPQPPPRGK
jgi:multiple sugar transport system substrate-binding protein